jgi:membrane-associated protein
MSDILLLLLGGTLAFGESIMGLGAFLPGEVMITGVAGSIDRPLLPLLIVAVVTGACLGDQLSYWTGRHLGPRLARSATVQRLGTERWDRATHLITRHGAAAVLVSRMLPVVRTIVPAVAGVARMSHLRFTLASIGGSTLWALVWVSAGPVLVELLRNPLLTGLGAAVGVFVYVAVRWGRRLYRSRRPGATRPFS